MPRLCTTKEVSEQTGLSNAWLRKMRHDTYRTGQLVGPPFRKIGKRVLYRMDDVQRWLTAIEKIYA